MEWIWGDIVTAHSYVCNEKYSIGYILQKNSHIGCSAVICFDDAKTSRLETFMETYNIGNVSVVLLLKFFNAYHSLLQDYIPTQCLMSGNP